jgi:hypothetical protein
MRPPQQLPEHPPQHTLLTALAYYEAPDGPSFAPLSVHPPHQQQVVALSWSPWMGAWDQQSLANSFNTMALTPLMITDWVAYSDASNHTTSDAGSLTSIHPPTFTDPSSIVVGNRSALSVSVFFPPAIYRVVKIMCSYSEVVL